MKSYLCYLLPLSLLVGTSLAQVEMREPAPRRSKFSKYYMDSDDVDYNMKTPLNSVVGYPCRKFPEGPVQGTLIAGHNFKVFFDGTATRQGGDCQFAISYDNGTTFGVLWDKQDNCLLDTINGGYDVPIPETLPRAKRAIFAWTWIEALSDRSFFMNCADVRVENYGTEETFTGRELLVVNVPGMPTLAPKEFAKKDDLAIMFEKRPFVNVGEVEKPKKRVEEESTTEESTESDSSVEEQSNDAEETANSDSDSGTVVLLVSEDTSTTTHVVYATQFITEEDTEADYTYGHGIQTRGGGARIAASNGNEKPIYGTNVGLTIISESADINQYTQEKAFPSFTFGSIHSAQTSDSSASEDYIPPSLSPPHRTTSISGPEAQGLDILASTNTGASMAPTAVPLGTPLFDDKRAISKGPLDIGGQGDKQYEHELSTLGGYESTIKPFITNRPDIKSVLASASVSLNHRYQTQVTPAASVLTMMKTVTVNDKPVLQVVVSSNNTVIPASLTISYSNV